jgi:hypothetical protein
VIGSGVADEVDCITGVVAAEVAVGTLGPQLLSRKVMTRQISREDLNRNIL